MKHPIENKINKIITDSINKDSCDLIVFGDLNKKAKLDIGKGCNANCNFCYYKERLKERHFLPLETAKYLINSLIQKGIDTIELSGGEPLIYPHLEDVLKYIKKQGINTSIVTNLSSNKVNSLVEKGLLDGILISLHGNESNHNNIVKLKTHKKIMTFIDEFHDKLPIRINTVIEADGYNLIDTDKFMFPLLISGKVKQWNLLPLNFWSDAKNNKQTELDTQKQNKRIKDILTLWEKVKTNAEVTVRYFSLCFLPDNLKKYVRTHLHHIIDITDWNIIYYPNDNFQEEAEIVDFSQENTRENLIKKALQNRCVSHIKSKVCLDCEDRLICDGFKKQHKHEPQYKRTGNPNRLLRN